jgi:hypothetical protein
MPKTEDVSFSGIVRGGGVETDGPTTSFFDVDAGFSEDLSVVDMVVGLLLFAFDP